MLSRVLAQRRHNVITDHMTKKDSGALVDIANNFHIRHGDGRLIQSRAAGGVTALPARRTCSRRLPAMM